MQPHRSFPMSQTPESVRLTMYSRRNASAKNRMLLIVSAKYLPLPTTAETFLTSLLCFMASAMIIAFPLDNCMNFTRRRALFQGTSPGVCTMHTGKRQWNRSRMKAFLFFLVGFDQQCGVFTEVTDSLVFSQGLNNIYSISRE